MNKLRTFFQPEDGATAVEYGIMVALIAAVIIGVVVVLGGQVKDGFCDVSEAMPGTAAGGTEGC